MFGSWKNKTPVRKTPARVTKRVRQLVAEQMNLPEVQVEDALLKNMSADDRTELLMALEEEYGAPNRDFFDAELEQRAEQSERVNDLAAVIYPAVKRQQSKKATALLALPLLIGANTMTQDPVGSAVANHATQRAILRLGRELTPEQEQQLEKERAKLFINPFRNRMNDPAIRSMSNPWTPAVIQGGLGALGFGGLVRGATGSLPAGIAAGLLGGGALGLRAWEDRNQSNADIEAYHRLSEAPDPTFGDMVQELIGQREQPMLAQSTENL
jgi:hypothetical protein